MGVKAKEEQIRHQTQSPKTIALVGNPNVGKSTLFNGLTGMNQHTGNWPGKTVESARGHCKGKKFSYTLIDLPGTYSLIARSAEEEVARNFICFDSPHGVVILCDATCLERNLNLVLQTMEITNRVLVCVNLLDEAHRKHIKIDLAGLSKSLGVPVIGTVAHKKKSLSQVLEKLDELMDHREGHFRSLTYEPAIEDAITAVEPSLKEWLPDTFNSRWLALRFLEGDRSLLLEASRFFHHDFFADLKVLTALETGEAILQEAGLDKEGLTDSIVTSLMAEAEHICSDNITFEKENYQAFDRRLDHLFTGKLTGYPIMMALLALIFWLTITGANYPSQLLSEGLFWIQQRLTDIFMYFEAPLWLHDALILGVYRVLSWVISVMLPPMAIFFPLFTLLEDSGYLPRIAYNLDRPFKCCFACGKQALTMCMGFGCNAVGVTGCRIIDSPRERLLAILTNNFVPCNGRFPGLIAILTMFFIGTKAGAMGSILSAILLSLLILLGIGMTFFATWLLSKTVLKGIPSSFTLELPSYRRPQFGKVILRSVFDRTLFVLGRAVCVAAPAGLLIWLMANLQISGISLVQYCADFLNPIGQLIGLDGAILLAFILGLPANEIVLPLVIMIYMAEGSLLELSNLDAMYQLFTDNGWTLVTASCFMLFSLMHWPCSTTLLTIKKETGSWKWSILAFILPTLCGIGSCMILTLTSKVLF